MSRDQGPTTREGGARIACGVSKPIATVRRDWVLLILFWAAITLTATTLVIAISFYI